MTRNLFRPIASLVLTTGLLLMIPVVAMQFTDEVIWTLSDFLVAGTVLFGTGFSYIMITRMLAKKSATNITYRFAVGLALFGGLLLLWMNMAVGIIGSEDNLANLMYYGVLAVGLIGALIARFQPKGMDRTLFAMALAQAIVATIALMAGLHHLPGSSVAEIFGLNGLFIVLFWVSGLLFHRASARQKSVATDSTTSTA